VGLVEVQVEVEEEHFNFSNDMEILKTDLEEILNVQYLAFESEAIKLDNFDI